MPVSFSEYLEIIFGQTTHIPLNHVAMDYWRDYISGQPIDGGVAYEALLRKVPLDGSLASLQILDKFLDKAKPHLAANPLLISQKTDQRNLLIFIAFYTGWVLGYYASQAKYHNHNNLSPTLHWVSFDKLCQTMPPVQRVINNDFSYSLAASLLPIPDNEQTFVPSIVSDSVYFPLVTVIERLYPQRQNTLTATAPFFGYISDSLYASVTNMLKRWQQLSLQTATPLPTLLEAIPTTADNANNVPNQNQPVQPTLPTSLLSDLDNPLMERKDWQASDEPTPSSHQPVITHFDFVVPDFTHLSMQAVVVESVEDPQFVENIVTESPHNEQVSEPNPNETSVNREISPPATDTVNIESAKSSSSKQKNHQQIDSRKLSSRQAIAEAKKQAKEIARLKAEREAQEKAEAEARRQAEIAEALANPKIHEKLLNQPKSMIDNKPLVKDSFSELEQDLQVANLPDSISETVKHAYSQSIAILQQHDTAHITKALAVIDKLAKANVTDAMLHQALWLLRGREDLGVAQDSEQGIALVKTAASLADSRAEKLLSKLYFSGELVGTDSEQAKYWLAQAAVHGHAEAQRLQQSFVIVGTLNEARKDEDNYLKKLAIGTGILIVLMLIVIFAVKI